MKFKQSKLMTVVFRPKMSWSVRLSHKGPLFITQGHQMCNFYLSLSLLLDLWRCFNPLSLSRLWVGGRRDLPDETGLPSLELPLDELSDVSELLSRSLWRMWRSLGMVYAFSGRRFGSRQHVGETLSNSVSIGLI